MNPRVFPSLKIPFIFSVFIFWAAVVFFPSASLTAADPAPGSKKSDSNPSNYPIEKFNEFVREWETFTKGMPDKKDLKKWFKKNDKLLEEIDMEDEVNSFLNNLEEHAEDPEAAVKELRRKMRQRVEERQSQSKEVLDFKTFQTKVFFGGWATFFTIVAVLFILRYGYNILRDSVLAVRNMIFNLLGLQTRHTYDLLSPLPLMDQDTEPVEEAPPKQRKRKAWLFGEVLKQFINPLVDQGKIDASLEEQSKRKPQPKIGDLLKESGLITDEEIAKTVAKQKKFRN